MKILVSYRGIPQSPGWATGDLVVSAFRELGHEVYPYAKNYQQNDWVDGGLSNLDSHNWDLILYMECNDADPQYSELRLVKAKQKACWLFDTSYYPDSCKRLVDYFDFEHIFLANPLTVQKYKAGSYNNVHYLPYAVDPDKHFRSFGAVEKTRDVALVGSIRDDRIALSEALESEGVKLELIGDVFREDYIDALASSKIIINQNPDMGRGLLNMRYWETCAAGSFIMTEIQDFLQQPEDFNTRVGLPYYKTDDLAWQCKQMLESQQLENFIKIGQNKVMKHHTYKQRCERIIDAISD